MSAGEIVSAFPELELADIDEALRFAGEALPKTTREG